MSADSFRRKERVYLLEFKARWVSWLPWPRRSMSFSKITDDWQAVHDMAAQINEGAETEVEILWWELENAPPELLEGR